MRTEDEVKARIAELTGIKERVEKAIKSMRSKKGLSKTAFRTLAELQSQKVILSASLYELNWMLKTETDEPADNSTLSQSPGALRVI